MKLLSLCSFLLIGFLPLTFAAETKELHELSIIKSIDDLELPPYSSEATEEALPQDRYLELLDLLQTNDFTVLAESRVQELFNSFKKNPRARMRVAGGKCSYRRSYIQGYLKKLGISSGKLYIQCPSKKGHLRLIDRSSGRRYTFSNFHDTNIVAIPNGYQVMDVQFEDGPVSLSGYLAEVEASQKLKPLRNRASGDRGYCYWSIY